jgi:plasmid maintenance system antidote protein VapI
VTEAASVLGVTRQAFSNLLNETFDRHGSQDRKAFGPKMDHLVRMQLAFDLAEARGRRQKSRSNGS